MLRDPILSTQPRKSKMSTFKLAEAIRASLLEVNELGAF